MLSSVPDNPEFTSLLSLLNGAVSQLTELQNSLDSITLPESREVNLTLAQSLQSIYSRLELATDLMQTWMNSLEDGLSSSETDTTTKFLQWDQSKDNSKLLPSLPGPEGITKRKAKLGEPWKFIYL